MDAAALCALAGPTKGAASCTEADIAAAPTNAIIKMKCRCLCMPPSLSVTARRSWRLGHAARAAERSDEFAPSKANAHLALPCEPVDQAGGLGSTGRPGADSPAPRIGPEKAACSFPRAKPASTVGPGEHGVVSGAPRSGACVHAAPGLATRTA